MCLLGDLYMDEFIDVLKNIQQDLVGLILPVCITAIVSIITVVLNLSVKIVQENRRISIEQFKTMQDIYPQLRISIIEISISVSKIVSNPIYKNFKESLNKYLVYKKDEAQYRKNNKKEVENIDSFIDYMTEFLEQMSTLNSLLSTKKIPLISFYHPILKKKTNKMIATFHFYSVLFKKYIDSEVSGELLIAEMNFKKEKNLADLNFDDFKKYIVLLDKWFKSY